MKMTKFGAFFTHLLISAAVVGVFLALTFFVWYPAPYFEADGANAIIGILAGVDVILGPILTLIVFKPGKPRLKLDLGLIAAVQLSAFLYGSYVIFTERPGYIVHVIDSFMVVPAGAVDFDGSSYPELEAGLFGGPTLVYGRYRRENEPAEALLQRIMASDGEISKKSEYYEPYDNGIESVLRHALPVKILLQRSEKDAAVVEHFAAKRGVDLESLKYVPLIGKNKAMAMILDAETAEPLGAIDVRPS